MCKFYKPNVHIKIPLVFNLCKLKVIHFWSFNFFFIFKYDKRGVLDNNYISIKKCTTTFLWVLNFGEVGEILENFQKHPLGESF